MVYGIAWQGMGWCMVWPGRMTCIWYGLAVMTWYMVWSSRHGMVYGVVAGMAWYMACPEGHCMVHVGVVWYILLSGGVWHGLSDMTQYIVWHGIWYGLMGMAWYMVWLGEIWHSI